ncbi:MAG: DUF2924 domain-containing protein [Acidobacteriota bacterium]
MDAKMLEGLTKLTTAALKRMYVEIIGEASKSSNKDLLARRLAWKIQSRPKAD